MIDTKASSGFEKCQNNAYILLGKNRMIKRLDKQCKEIQDHDKMKARIRKSILRII